MWVFDIEDRDQIANKAHKSRKTMVTIFINIDSLQLLDVKPKGIKINANYFIEHIISPLESLEITEKAKIKKQAMYLHYDNLDITSFTLMPHPCYSSDLAHSDFEIFDKMKNSFVGQDFESEEVLFEAI